ncbi:MAG: cysteine--tRNA ligase [Proteobacteria bacterium]|nr:cysteine--tRNA ligase [Pseudomonadota bacterium]
MSLVLYNTLSQKKEKFEPHQPPQVKMYCCGPTVYDFLHVGNFRGAIFYNALRNWLEHLGYQVTFVYNYTDVDDKIIDRANKDKVSAKEISEKFIKEFETDYARLGLRKHTHNPKVSDYMKPIQDMVTELIEKKKAYSVNGEVLYSVRAFSEYGKLSHRNVDDMRSGTRVEVDEKKQDPLDFALWKPTKPGEPSWDSPWGPGRPGWHIECSAMAKALLGEQIDIHGGGLDLVFPHHENEIAQSEGCTHKSFVKYWVHNNMLNFGGAKMSKSLGNIRTGRSFMDEFHPEIFKFLILASHYRSVSDFGEASIDQSIGALARIYSALALAESFLPPPEVLSTTVSLQFVDGKSTQPPIEPKVVKEKFISFTELDQGMEKQFEAVWVKITEALNDDMGTPEVFALIFEQVRAFNSAVKWGMKANPAVQAKARSFRKFVLTLGSYFALFQLPAKAFLISLDDMLLRKMDLRRSEIDQIVKERTDARATKDFSKSDELRKKLTEMGISVSDTAEGSFWEVAK